MTGYRDIWLFAALAIAWGTAFGAIEVGLETLPPLLFAALRFDVAAAVFVAAVVWTGRPWRPGTSGDWVAIAVAGVLLVGTHFALLFVGQSYVSSAVSAIVVSLIPIVTPPIALALLPRERIRAPAVVGLSLGLAGIVLIAVSGGSVDGHAVGVGLLFASVLSFAVGSVLLERTRRTLPTLSLQAWAMVVGAALLHGLSALHPAETLATFIPAPTVIGALAYLGVVSTGGGFLAYFLLLDRVGATEASLVNYAAPVVAALVGWAALGETITLATIVGFTLIVAGFAWCKIDAIWKRVAPLVGYGPRRPTRQTAREAADDRIVDGDGNVYVANPGRGLDGCRGGPTAD